MIMDLSDGNYCAVLGMTSHEERWTFYTRMLRHSSEQHHELDLHSQRHCSH